MLAKRNLSMNSVKRTVKSGARAAASAAVIATLVVPSMANAKDSLLVERKITSKFKMSELQKADGLEDVYSRLQKKAYSACRADQSTLAYTGASIKSCANDLISQFIESANVETLTAYHRAKTEPTRVAMLVEGQ